jgi:hypothetical protein
MQVCLSNLIANVQSINTLRNLRDLVTQTKQLVYRVLEHLEKYFEVNRDLTDSNLEEILNRPHRKATSLLSSYELSSS